MPRELTYAEKMQALQALIGAPGEPVLRMRDDLSWYVSAPISIRTLHTLRSLPVSGRSPEHAIEIYWNQIVNLERSEEYLVVEYAGRRTAARWNGFMWRVIEENQTEAAVA